MLLPDGDLHDGRDRRALRLSQQTDDLVLLQILPAFAAVVPFEALLSRLGAGWAFRSLGFPWLAFLVALLRFDIVISSALVTA
jgi:hypothetical protein